MLLQALKARTEHIEGAVAGVAEKVVPKQRQVGKKLRLSEY
jgi:hypothetical protein